MDDFKTYLNHNSISPDKKLSFKEYFYKLLNEHNLEPSDVYNAIGMSRQTFSKILNSEVRPTFNNAIKLAFGLRCDAKESKLLLKKLDYTLASYSKFNLGIRYCLDHKIYNIVEVNKFLFDNFGKTLDD